VSGSMSNGHQWESNVFLDTVPVTIDDKEFDRWVGNKLDSTLGPRLTGAPTTMLAAGTQAVDYLAMSKILGTVIKANMMQFSQSMSPNAVATGTVRVDIALTAGKGFDQNQIAKLWDTCGIRNSQQIPPIWVVTL
jgi:hypothetical protein